MTTANQQKLDDDQEKLAELIAIKVSEKYIIIMKEYVSKEIQIHAFQCAAGKWGWAKSFMSAITGGLIVGVVLWMVTK